MRHILAMAMAAGALGACSSVSVRQPDVRTATAFEGPQAGVDPALAPADLDRWWTLFDDPQLVALIDEGLATAPDVRSALARLDEVRANRSEALYSTLPQGQLTASGTEQKTDVLGGAPLFAPTGSLRTLQAAFNVTWELDFFGRSRAALSAANADLAAARFSYEGARQLLASQIGQALFSARLSAVQLVEARETVRISGELFRVTRVRAERGLGAGADAARTEADVATAQAEVARLEAQLRQQKRNLLVLIGRGAGALDSLPVEAAAAPAPGVPASTPGALLARRPDVREAEARVAGAVGRVRFAKLQLFPSFTLRPGASLSDTSGAFESQTATWSLGLGLALPVLDRPRLLAAARAEGARAEQAVVAYEKVVQTAYAEAENALAALDADRTRVRELERAEERARFAFDAATTGFRAGLTDLTSVLDIERLWRGARNQAAAARSQALIDSVAAFKALGGGWTPIETLRDARRPPALAENAPSSSRTP